jgi:raffinose/stachyose/melibiose transport system substrate-binding protein
MFKPTKALVALAVGMLALSATACGGSGSSKVLKLWYYESADSAMGTAWQQAIKKFEQTHPGVTVKFEEKSFEQMRKTAPMVLNSNKAPDILEYDKGNATTGLLAQKGLLADMTPEVTRRGWDKLLPPDIQETSKYDAKGVMGGDKWYGVPNYAEYLMVYYNKSMFDQHGIKVPKTFDEFTAAMDVFVKKGVTPLANGAMEYPGQHYLYQLALSKADPTWVSNYQRYTGKADFHDAAWTYAATTLADWVKKGYISKNSAGLKAEDAGVGFISGKHPMFFSGSWWYGRFEKEIKSFQWDSFLWPGTRLTPGSGGNLWVVPKSSGNKKLAYDFIDTTMKKDIQNLLAGNGGVPVAADVTSVTDPKNRELIQHYQALASANRLGFYPDWPVPGFYDVLAAATQKLINGSASPQSVLSGLASSYNENRPSH